MIEACEENSNYKTARPPNCIYLLQPLEEKWREILDICVTNSTASIPKEYFSNLLRVLWLEMKNVENFNILGRCSLETEQALKRIPDGLLEGEIEDSPQKVTNSCLTWLKIYAVYIKRKTLENLAERPNRVNKLKQICPYKLNPVQKLSRVPLAKPITGSSGTQKLIFASSDETSEDVPLAQIESTRKQAK